MKTFDSTLAYYVNQLDNLDKKLHEPLYNVSWGRDISLRTGITMANESTSFIRSNFGAIGTQNAAGKPWISPNTTTLPAVSINGERVVLPLRLLGQEVSYSSVELERSMLLGQPIDVQKFDAMNAMYQMHTDEMIYVGDSDVSAYGLLNSPLVSAGSVAAGASTDTEWNTKTPDEILADINTAIQEAWAATGYAACPNKLLLPPAQFAYIASQKVSTAGNISILQFVEENSISLRVNGMKLDVQPVKWLTGRGVASADRMVAYTNQEDKVRFPMVPIRRETPYYLGIKFNAPYIWGFGEVEFVYPEAAVYKDGI
jgi:hypothetical protein